MELPEKLKGILANLPDKPGCYLMYDKAGEIIYIGKAINLKNRVRSYFQQSNDHSYKTRQLIRRIADIETILAGSELEALILEMNLIKEHRPFFNVRLKDDKRYPYIRVTWQDPFPRLSVTRMMINDGSRYFGPYTSVWAVHQTLDVLRKIFPYLTCAREITGKDSRACLFYDLKLCSAPCIGAIGQSDYREMMDNLCAFLEGKTDPVIHRLKENMEKASDAMEYEQAATIRDQLNAIERVVERQKIISDTQKDSDIIAMARDNGEACVQVFFVRNGKLIGREYFILEGTDDEQNEAILEEFVKQFYAQAAYVPSQVLLPEEVEEAKIIKEWLNTKRNGEKVELTVPKRGEAWELVQMASENAAETLRSLKSRWKADREKQHQALAELQSSLKLPAVPLRIECYDISNTQGTASVGSMVVFVQGVPSKKDYRRFNIRSVVGPDDFASMEEVLRRRFNHYLTAKEKEKEPGSKPDTGFGNLPDLLIVDGGKGQLSRAVNVLAEFDFAKEIAIAGLAKQEEELFLPGKSESIRLPERSQALYLVQRIRDEAHRFAITAHRKRRGKIGLSSRLENIKGLGPVKRKALLKKFGSIEGILKAQPQEIAEIKGFSIEMAQAIQSQLE